MKQFTVGGKQVSVWPGDAPGKPVVYLNTFGGEGGQVYEILKKQGCPDFNFVAVGNLIWDHDMAPWDIPPIEEGDTPCTGGADEYLRLFTGEIMQAAEKEIKGEPLWRCLAGYSLGGLFAVYSLCQTGIFSRIASMSGSFWYPGIREYVFSHEMKTKPEHMYFSLGDREREAGNPYLKTVQENTEAIEAFYREKGIDTCFHMNKGGHYQDEAARTAAGILWMLNR